MRADPQAPHPARPGIPLLGLLALGLTVLVWAGFFLSLRLGAKTALPPLEIALFRFLPAGLCFLPVLWRRWRQIVAVPWPLFLMMVCGAGLPYFLVAGMGMRHAPVADGSTLVPGTLPLSVSLLALLFLRQPVAPGRRTGLALIGAGVALMLLFSLSHPQPGLGQGYALFLLGSLLWAGFTLALRRSGLGALEGAAVLTYGSLPPLLIALALRATPLRLPELPTTELALQFVLQGLGVGIVSTLSYAYAVARLGSDRAAIAGALTPVAASLLAVPLLGEMPPLTSLLGMTVIVAGVLLANRAAHPRTQPPNPPPAPPGQSAERTRQ